MRAHKLTFAALAVAAGLSLTACQNDGAGQSDPSSAASSSAGGSDANGGAGSAGSDQDDAKEPGGNDSSKTASGGQGAGAGADAKDKVGKCRTDGLKITAQDATVGGDKDHTVAVELKNSSGRDCAISGFAGVDLKTSQGSLSAQRTSEPVVPAVLKSGESTYFGINYPVNDSGGSGVRITGLVVTPPDETKSVTLAWPGEGTLPVTEGGGSSVTVGPMESAGQGG